jgi:S1-C subfamily serine protease
MMSVRRRWGNTPAQRQLLDGDVILSMNQQPVHHFRDADVIANSALGPSTVDVEVLRGGRKLSLALDTVTVGGDGPDQVLVWSGAVLQAPPAAARQQRGIAIKGVYVAATKAGSPANRFALQSTSRILEVDGEPTDDLDSFLLVTAGLSGKDKKERRSVRIKSVDLMGRVRLSTLVLDNLYWPTVRLSRGAGGEWTREELR